MEQKKKQWMQHIAGLRGLAILSVVLFHLSSRLFSNGYYGVDIFLVITGYLLFNGWKEGNDFSTLTFLRKKVLRIYPLLCVLLVLAGISSIPFWYHTNSALQFGMDSLASFLGFSNLRYIKEYSDYFATDSNVNPLLHTWYLSVTIQVYLLWALVGGLLKRASSYFRLPFIYLISLASLLYCFSFPLQQTIIDLGYSGWGQKGNISYYDPMGRIWQVLAGGLVCLLPSIKNKKLADTLWITGVIGVCYILFCNQQLPVWMSLIVTAGTVIIIRYAGESSHRSLLENRILLYAGKISFSLYLIHFPVFVFFRRWERADPNLLFSIILLAITFILAWVIWRWVESRKLSPIRVCFIVFAACATICLTRGANKLGLKWDIRDVPYPDYTLSPEHTQCSESVYAGYNKHLLKGDSGTQSLLRCQPTPPILSLSGMKNAPQFVLVGNSNAQHLYAGFHEVCKERGIPGIHLTSIVFPMWDHRVLRTDSYNWTEEKAKAFVLWLKQQPDIHTVVISHLWKSRKHAGNATYSTWNGKVKDLTAEARLKNTKAFCTQMRKAGKHVVILTPSPCFTDFEDAALLGKGEDYTQWRKQRNRNIVIDNEDDPFVISKEEYMHFNADVFDFLYELEHDGYCKLLHIEKSIFNDGNWAGVKNGVLFCCDKTHITPAASIYIMQGVADDFESIMKHNQQHPITPEKP